MKENSTVNEGNDEKVFQKLRNKLRNCDKA